MRQKAYEAMQKGPVASEVRTPTNIWFGQGFSRSMPSHEWNRTDNKKFKNRLDTNYEVILMFLKTYQSCVQVGVPVSARLRQDNTATCVNAETAASCLQRCDRIC